MPITSIQTLGANAACNGTTVKVRGIVTGIDDLYGSTFDAIYKADSGIWIQEPTRDPDATTSNALFVAGIRRNAANPAGVIGSDITITGRVETKFGQVGIVPAGVGNTGSPAAQEVDLTSVATINSPRQRAARPRRARPDQGRGPGPGPRVLPLAAGHAREAARGHRDRRRHDQVPRRVRGAGHDGAAPVPQERPGGQRARRGTTSRPSSASRPTAAPATRPTRGCRGRARRRSTSTSSTSSATSSARSATASATTRSCRRSAAPR